MKRTAVFILAAFLLLPIPGRHETGLYNTITHLIWCTDSRSCEHEIGHYIDGNNGWISKTPEYKTALDYFIFVELKVNTRPGDPLAIDIVQMIGQPIQEIYASIYAATGGNVPRSLKRFYPDPPEFHKIKLPKGYLYYALDHPGI